MNDLDNLCNEVLSQLELHENKLLSWGFVGGKFDVLSEIKNTLSNPVSPLLRELYEKLTLEGICEQDIANNLLERRLIIMDRNSLGRTRYAETIKLLYQLKQRFNKDDWQSGSNLVSNYKLDLRRRRFPKRDQKWENVQEAVPSHRALALRVIKALLNDGTLSLAKFQVRSVGHLLTCGKASDAATIIGAGTGAGKTKAFYLPAFALIIEDIKKNHYPFTKVLGVYPRVELLKDQVKEAIAQIKDLSCFFEAEKIRKIKIGAYFGDTPPSSSDIKDSRFYKWTKGEIGYVCPYVLCPNGHGLMEWGEESLNQEISRNADGYYGEFEVLCCPKCGEQVSSIQLTRKSMCKHPPDILFTTTEMINRKIGDSSERHVFGINQINPPRLLLLDEVHIYDGLAGAQVAYVLRRWRYCLRYVSPESNISFVGLSATLTRPDEFFAKLTGVPLNNTTYLEPNEDELSSEGIEYNVVLRGDPISITALLSTTVQTAMLLGRMLDPLAKDVSRRAWGKKIYGFSDKLDTVARWIHIERNAETERCLAQFRDPSNISLDTRDAQVRLGQMWAFAKEIDHNCLKRALTLDVTSSRSRGVNPNSKLVIATSTLEVGFNDSSVGAVIQHKAPRNMSSFLQRKGRAGRVREMRPWMVVVTSAYGRDRWSFEHPEQLFNPVLPEMTLPIRNQYVKHVQAGFAFMDWLGIKLEEFGCRDKNIWNVLAPKNRGYYKKEKKALLVILEELLVGSASTTNSVYRYVGNSMQLSEYDLRQVFWAPPRSIFLDLMPWLYSGVSTDWQQGVVEDSIIDEHPLCGKDALALHVPRNLFSDLESSEIMIKIVNNNSEPEYLDLQTVLYEYAPGNVSKRFADQYNKISAHWVALPASGENIDLNGDTIQSQVIRMMHENNRDVIICSPYAISIEQIPKGISDRSSGRLKWETIIEPNGVDQISGGQALGWINQNVMCRVLNQARIFSSDNHEGVLFTRYATTTVAEIKDKQGGKETREVSFDYSGQPAAIGFSVFSDTLYLSCKPKDWSNLQDQHGWERKRAEFAPQYFYYKLREDSRLGELTVFEIEWLWQVAFASIVAIGISRSRSIRDSIDYFGKHMSAIAERSLEVIFQVIDTADSEDDDRGNLCHRLIDLLHDERISSALLDNAQVLYMNPDTEFWLWIQNRYPGTVAAAFLSAVEQMIPDVSVEDLLVDIDEQGIWISEGCSGGIGIITRIVAEIQNRPKEFDECFAEAATYCRRSSLTSGLTTTLNEITSQNLSTVVSSLRSAVTLEEQEAGLVELQRALFHVGITPKRDLIVSIMYKLVNPNTSIKTDEFIKMLHERWIIEMSRLQCSISPRVFAVAALGINDVKDGLDDILRDLLKDEAITDKHRFNLLEAMLWDSCQDYCPDCLQVSSKYSEILPPSRICLSSIISDFEVVVDYVHPEWRRELRTALEQHGKVNLITSYEELSNCRRDLLIDFQNPIEIGFEIMYPFLSGATNKGSQWIFAIEIREVLHG